MSPLISDSPDVPCHFVSVSLFCATNLTVLRTTTLYHHHTNINSILLQLLPPFSFTTFHPSAKLFTQPARHHRQGHTITTTNSLPEAQLYLSTQLFRHFPSITSPALHASNARHRHHETHPLNTTVSHSSPPLKRSSHNFLRHLVAPSIRPLPTIIPCAIAISLGLPLPPHTSHSNPTPHTLIIPGISPPSSLSPF